MPTPAAPMIAAAPGPATRRAQRDFLAFRAWRAAAGHDFLPATGAALEEYVADLARTRARGTIDRHLAAIAAAHRARGFSAPTDDPLVRRRLRALKPPVDPRRRRPTPPGPEELIRMADACPGDLAGLRDRALLLLAASGMATPATQPGREGAGFSRAALVGLDAEHVRFTPAGADILLTGERALVVALAARATRCPVAALRDWMRASDSAFGPVFRKVGRTGGVEPGRLGTDAVRRILLRRAPRRGRGGRPVAP